MNERKRFVVPVLLVLLAAAGLYGGLMLATPALLDSAALRRGLPDIAAIAVNSTGRSLGWNLLYTLLDFSHGPFLASLPAALGLLAGGLLGRVLEKRMRPLAGNGTGGQGSRYGWLVCGQFCAMVLANLFWRHLLGRASAPTFAPLVSVTPVAILYFGKPNGKKLFTGVILGALLPVWVVHLLLTNFSEPLALPGFAGVGLAIGLSNLIAFLLFRRLPWMNDGVPALKDAMPVRENPGAGFLVWTRTLGADFAELCFWGGSLAGFGFLFGGMVCYLMDPCANAYGTQYPLMLASFLLTLALAMLFWGPKFCRDGYAFTFETLLVVGPLVGAFSTWGIAIPVCVLSAAIAPAVVRFALDRTIFGKWPPCVAVQTLAAGMVILGTSVIRLFGF